VFKKDERKEFPVALLERFQWKECPKCGIEYARSGCPVCDPALGGVVKERIVTTVHGKVTVTFVKKTSGTIVYATYQKGRGMQYLVFERKEFKRESDEVVYRGDIDPQVRYRISGKKTMFGKHEQMLILEGGKQTQNISVSSTVSVPCFDANDKHVYWAQGEQLVRDGDFGTSEFIGNILGGQTRFWVGTTFGFGFYTAGLVRVNFVFDALHRGLNDTVKLPPIRGQMIDARCYFADGQCWFLWTSQEVGVRKNNCVVIKKDGTVLAYAEAPEGDDSWLGTIGAKCATGPVLLAATDEGIVQVKVDGSTIVEAQKFPETEPYVDTGCSLFVGDGGLYVVTRQEILHLKIQP
jgi:H/ACA ribonucleoprotein complex subunit 3